MIISNIHIKNFKGFAEKSFDFKSKFTVVVGANASGKTTILEALSVALGSFLLGIDDIKSRNIDPKEIHTITINGQPRPQKPVSIEANGIIDTKIINWKREIISKNPTSKDAKAVSDIAKAKLLASRKKETSDTTFFPIIAYYSTGRLWALHEKIDFQAQEEGVQMAYKNCLTAKASSKEFLEWFKTQEDSIAKFQKPLDIAHLKALKEIISEMIPDGRWADVSFDRKANELVGIFTTNEGEKHQLSYSQLSDGYRIFISMIADIAYRCIQLNPHLGEKAVKDTEGVVLIDELDLHLHPNWQRQVVQMLKNGFPNIQFIVTTHSPFIVQQLDVIELINLDESNADVSPKNLPIHKVATQYMGVTNIRSDDFEQRHEEAKLELDKLQDNKGEITLDDYQKISEIVGNLLKDETDDPVYKAYLEQNPNKNATDL